MSLAIIQMCVIIVQKKDNIALNHDWTNITIHISLFNGNAFPRPSAFHTVRREILMKVAKNSKEVLMKTVKVAALSRFRKPKDTLS